MTGEIRPPSAEMVEALQAENLRLQQVCAQQAQILHERAQPIALAMLDTIENWCSMAEQPGHPMQAMARSFLEKWVRANERAQRVAAGIVLARNIPQNGHGK